jgi:hypothetical protein
MGYFLAYGIGFLMGIVCIICASELRDKQNKKQKNENCIFRIDSGQSRNERK